MCTKSKVTTKPYAEPWLLRIEECLLLMCICAETASADSFAVDARQQGMADATVAIADGTGALRTNPAGLAAFPQRSISATRRAFLTALDDHSNIDATSFAYTGSLSAKKIGWGFSYNAFAGADYFSDQLLELGMGCPLPAFKFGQNDEWYAGATLRYQARHYKANAYTADALNNSGGASGQADPLFAENGFSASATGADVGLLVRSGHTTGGFSISNFNRPSFSLGASDDVLPTILRLGGAHQFSWALMSVEARRAKQLKSSTDHEWAAAMEKMVYQKNNIGFGVRFGYEQGGRELGRPAGGFTAQLHELEIAYGFSTSASSLNGAGGDHVVTIAYHFL